MNDKKDFSVSPTGPNLIIADRDITELDQAYVQYKSGAVTAKVGRQVLTFDGHRHIGHVGWRQDRQTFDAASVAYAPSKDLSIKYAYITERKGINGDVFDSEQKDHLLNASYQTSFGKLVGYNYRLKKDMAGAKALNTLGASLMGKKDSFSYTVELAKQSKNNFDATYTFLEAGYNFGAVTAKLGYEVLGSDDGMYGFDTPYSTKHKFNGWADLFLATPKEGLEDVMFTLAGALAGGKWAVIYHDFSSDEGSLDLGSEINAIYTRPINKTFSFGAKLASYSAEDAFNGGAKVVTDTERMWAWIGAKF